jgi:outer membrane protein
MTLLNNLNTCKMRTLLLSLGLVILLPCQSLHAQTSAIKIGYTNVDYILSLLPEAKEIEAELTAYSKQLESQLGSKYQEFQDKLADYQQKASSGEMIPEVMRDKEAELNTLRQSIEKFQRDADASIQKKQVELLQPAYDKIQKAINEVSEANNYTHVFSSDAGSFAVLLYAREEDNITNLVLTKLGIEPPPTEE